VNLAKPMKQMKTGPGYQIDVLLDVEFIVKLYAQITHNVQRLNGVPTIIETVSCSPDSLARLDLLENHMT
jgi:hypothetical protein